MNDPHVARLIYRVEHSDGFSYEKAEPLDHAEPEFRVRIEDREATVEMIQHFATDEEARALVDPFLWVWEVDAGLSRGVGALRFAYQRAEIVHRKPTPGAADMHAAAGATSKFEGVAMLATYSDPPADLAFSSEVDAMFDRFERYKAGQTILGDFANFCQTVVESTPGQRSGAVKKYRIHRDVLKKLGELAERRAAGGIPGSMWPGARTIPTWSGFGSRPR